MRRNRVGRRIALAICWVAVSLAAVAAALAQTVAEPSVAKARVKHLQQGINLFFMEPLPDPKVIYNFHFYEPHLFTHQGATWGESYWHYLREVPYPLTVENVQAVEALVPDPVHKLAVQRYGPEHWNAARMEAEFAPVVARGPGPMVERCAHGAGEGRDWRDDVGLGRRVWGGG